MIIKHQFYNTFLLKIVIISAICYGKPASGVELSQKFSCFDEAFYFHVAANAVTNKEGVIKCYLADQNIFTYIAPPMAGLTLFQPGQTLYIPDNNDFTEEFIEATLSAQETGEYSTFLWVYEDAERSGRELVIESDQGMELIRMA
ncbi:MAG: hypothetical protein PHO37_11135, partial [Kiritimatiellae bacterium]|nr:hypothetical protein [Kiritimatiellia bacterium]